MSLEHSTMRGQNNSIWEIYSIVDLLKMIYKMYKSFQDAFFLLRRNLRFLERLIVPLSRDAFLEMKQMDPI